MQVIAILLIGNSCKGPLLVAVSIGRRNILFSNYREGDVDYEIQTEDLLHRNAESLDVGSMAER